MVHVRLVALFRISRNAHSYSPSFFVTFPLRKMNFFLSDPLRPAGDVWGVDGVDAARPSVLYALTGP